MDGARRNCSIAESQINLVLHPHHPHHPLEPLPHPLLHPLYRPVRQSIIAIIILLGPTGLWVSLRMIRCSQHHERTFAVLGAVQAGPHIQGNVRGCQRCSGINLLAISNPPSPRTERRKRGAGPALPAVCLPPCLPACPAWCFLRSCAIYCLSALRMLSAGGDHIVLHRKSGA